MSNLPWLFAVLIALGSLFFVFRLVKTVCKYLQKLPRMFDWLIAAVATCGLVFLLSPQQIPVSVYKINLIAIAGVLGYWLDRRMFPYARPDAFLGYETEYTSDPGDPLRFDLDVEPPNDFLFAVAMMRRALIVSAAMIAVGLGA